MSASLTAGVFTCAMLQIVTAKIDSIWMDNQRNQDYVAEVGVLTALRDNQTAKLSIIENPEKDKELKIQWIADCSTGAVDCDEEGENDCDFTGPEAEAKCKEYALDICSHVKFSIEENVFRTSEFSKEETLAIQFLARLKELDERLAQKAVAKLNTFAGTNQLEGGIGTVDGVTTYIAANFWGPDMFSYFSRVATMNKLKSVFMIHGSNLYEMQWQANLNAIDKTGINKINTMKSYWDLFNIDQVNDPDKVSYMLSKGAVAFANKAYYPLNSPQDYMTFKRWSIESKSLPGVKYDVFYKIRCSGEKIYHDYKIKVKAGIFLNPFGCNEDVTGVLKFVCGTAPAES